MADFFEHHQPGLSSPAAGAFAIVPDDAAPLPGVTRAIYVGGAGDIRITLLNGQTVTLRAVQPGAIYPVRCTHVRSGGTTAADLIGLV